jgi:hypothetical protein
LKPKRKNQRNRSVGAEPQYHVSTYLVLAHYDFQAFQTRLSISLLSFFVPTFIYVHPALAMEDKCASNLIQVNHSLQAVT